MFLTLTYFILHYFIQLTWQGIMLYVKVLNRDHNSEHNYNLHIYNNGWGTSNITSLLVLIKRHVSAYSEAIIRFTVFRSYCLCVANAEISPSGLYTWDINCVWLCMVVDVWCGVLGGGRSCWALLFISHVYRPDDEISTSATHKQ
jgi:hypothetical protein